MTRSHSDSRALLDNAKLNKDTAFTEAERKKYDLRGLLPPAIETIERQLERVQSHLAAKPSDIERYIYLMGLASRNETLFYYTLMSDPARFVPIVYDPTVADACLTFGHIFRRSTGMYLTRDMKGEFREILRNWPVKEVRFICVSTGGRILGLGDIGANGMGIPIGKLQLYTACAGVPPEGLLPVLLDIGTTNAALRADPLYLGLRELPPDDAEVDAIADAFVEAATEIFPGVCVHFEDWKGTDAMRLLARYRDKILCYNDDIQGTAAIVVAGLTTALQIKNEKFSAQRVLFLGAGSAGIGIAGMIASAMREEGLSEAEARERIALIDVNGLIESSRTDLNEWQKPFAHDATPTKDLLEVVKTFKPTVLIGVSTIGGAFTEEVVREMARLNERPVIFPLSNPTNRAECTAEQACSWTDGKALYAAGVQFPDFEYQGKSYHPGQANNFYIFPAIGLAVFATRPARITDDMFIAAAAATADQVDRSARERGMLFPLQANILETEVTTATRVAEHIFDNGQATVERPSDIRAWIEGLLYKPVYKEL
ncbi:NAD-dependent malic enzyme [Gluconacetobacter sp. 1c LMG 22058]|uniref:NAD-dependent malic enzyme n=1 Tax=Gluconacetobacter dulcium TaxID=2729096 RepID=A0A7W4PK12_9PROT|nr:NAD-dependent malic enzyme [Gluconacetobacter dulcium]MBB2199149.1 NAD-dependent malic enzyme [Gluconacetobacter dulcium]